MVRNSRDPRSGIQNGFWGIKFLIFVALIVASFFIPSGTIKKFVIYTINFLPQILSLELCMASVL